MKILQVMAGARHGGAETAFMDMSLALHEAGQDVRVVTRSNKTRVPPMRAAGITVNCLPFGGGLDVYTPWKMRRIIKDFKPDIVLTWMSRAAQKVPHWDEAMGIPPYKVVSRLGGYYKFKYFSNTDYFITITPDIKRYLVEECDVKEDSVLHINNFAETESSFTPINRISEGIAPDQILLLALGRLHESKAFDTLIEAVAGLEGLKLWIAGEGPDRAKLESLIAHKGCTEQIRLLGWRSDRAALFDAADICVFPSRYEPFGTVFVQAWANHVPLITTNADGPRQFVRDGQDGLIVPVDDVPALRAAMERLSADKDLQQVFIKNGYARYEREFSKERCVRAYISFFEQVLTKNL